MNKKVIRIAAVISAAALLCGGIYLLVKNDVAQRINWRDIMIYAPTPIARETLDETVDIEKSKPSADRVPEDTKEELTEQVRQLSNEHDDSVGWLYVPDTNIDYPIMQSGDNDYYTRRATDGSYLYAGSLFMDYFMNHSYGWLTTENDVRLIDFFAVARTSDTSGLYLAAPNFNEWDNRLRNCASIYKEVEVTESDHLLMLSLSLIHI